MEELLERIAQFIEKSNYGDYSAKDLDRFLDEFSQALKSIRILNFEEKGKILDIANKHVSIMFAEIHEIRNNRKKSMIKEIFNEFSTKL